VRGGGGGAKVSLNKAEFEKRSLKSYIARFHLRLARQKRQTEEYDVKVFSFTFGLE
jgi:hypothetical protein